MVSIRIDNFEGVSSAPPSDSLRSGQATAAENVDLTAPGTHGRGLKMAPGRTRIYPDAQDLEGDDRTALEVAEPADFNAATGAVLVATDQGAGGKVLAIHHHEDITRSVYEPTDAVSAASEYIHEQYTRVQRYSITDEKLVRFSNNHWYPRTHGIYPPAVAEDATLPADWLKYRINTGGVIGRGPNGSIVVVDFHIVSRTEQNVAPSAYTGETFPWNYERLEVMEFDQSGALVRSLSHDLLKSAGYSFPDASTRPRGRGLEILPIEGWIWIHADFHSFVIPPAGSHIIDKSEGAFSF